MPAGVNSSTLPLTASQQPAIAPTRHKQNGPSPPAPSEATMFGRIDNFESVQNEFTNLVGDQINVHRIPVPQTHRIPPPAPHSVAVSEPHILAPAKNAATSYDEPRQQFNANYTALEVTNTVVTALQNAARFCPFPILAQAATTVLAILQGAQVRA